MRLLEARKALALSRLEVSGTRGVVRTLGTYRVFTAQAHLCPILQLCFSSMQWQQAVRLAWRRSLTPPLYSCASHFCLALEALEFLGGGSTCASKQYKVRGGCVGCALKPGGPPVFRSAGPSGSQGPLIEADQARLQGHAGGAFPSAERKKKEFAWLPLTSCEESVALDPADEEPDYTRVSRRGFSSQQRAGFEAEHRHPSREQLGTLWVIKTWV